MEVESALSSYRIFNTVAKTGNLSLAAKELFISQPAISKAVHRLEQSLSVKLFVRKSRGVKLTEEGSLLYEYTCSAFHYLSLGAESVRRYRSAYGCTLRIGVIPDLCKSFLVPLLKDYLHQYKEQPPRIDLLKSVSSDVLTNHSQDLLFQYAPEKSSTVSFLPFCKMSFIFTAAGNSPFSLAQKSGKSGLSLKEFFSKTTLLYSEGSEAIPSLSGCISRYTPAFESVQKTDSMELLIEFTKMGIGIGILPRELVETELQNKELVELAVDEPLPCQTIGFSFLKVEEKKSSIHQFLTFLNSRQNYITKLLNEPKEN